MQPPPPATAPVPAGRSRALVWVSVAFACFILGALVLILVTPPPGRSPGGEPTWILGTLTPSTNATVLAAGRALFQRNCVICHGPQGQGSIGPNLCDAYALHGFAYTNIVTVISEGVPAKNMIAWKVVLPEEDLLALASYTWSLRGTQPPNARPPQGVAEP